MALCIMMGSHTFVSSVEGYENTTVQCANCGNISGRVFKRWEWFTLCFVPVLPCSFKPWPCVGCPICHYYQDLQSRPDVEQMKNGGGGQAGQYQMHGAPPPDYQAQPPPQHQPVPPQETAAVHQV